MDPQRISEGMRKNPKYDRLRSMGREEFLTYVSRACTRQHLAFLLGAETNVRLVFQKMEEFGVTAEAWSGKVSPVRSLYRELREKSLRSEWAKKFEAEVMPFLLIEDCRFHPSAARKFIRRWNQVYEWIPYQCETCGSDGSWLGKKLALQLDHRNGKNNDNRIENLRYLCPNCHAITESFCGRNVGKNTRRREAGEYVPPRVSRKGIRLDAGGRKTYRKLDHPE